MKKIFSILIILVAALNSFSQTTIRANQITADDKFFPPVKDTTQTPGRVGQLTIRAADTALYMAISITAPQKWLKIAKITDVPSSSTGTSFGFDSLTMVSITSYPGVSVQWTRGNVSSGSTSLSVTAAKDFAIGQWITVEGAGAAGVNLRTTITNVSGTTITINNAAGTSVTSARVRHDCTPGIQLALIDAVANPKKSTLFVPVDTATYVLSGPLVTSVDGVNPNSQLYIPKVEASGKMVTLRILGSTPPNMATEGTAAAPRNTQGCIFESTLTTEASGTEPAVLGTSYYNSGITGYKNYINTVIENLIIRTATKNPAGTDIAGTMSGIHFQRMTQKYFDNVKIDISSALVDRVYPVNTTIGIYSPEVNNKAELDNGKIFIEGYYYGHIPGEHELTRHYLSLANAFGVSVGGNYYNIFYTRLTAELNTTNIELRGTSNIGISSYDTEHGTVGVGFPFEYDIKQVSGDSRVHIWTSMVSQSGTGPGPGITIITSGSPNYTIDHGTGQNRFAAKLIDIALYPTDSLTGYWALENETGDFPDSTGNGFDLTRVNGTTTVASKVDRGANFVAASSQALSGSASNRLSAAAGLTVGGWFKIATGTTGLRALFSKWGSGQAEWTIYWAEINSTFHFAASSDGTAFVDINSLAGPDYLADDSWHFVVGVWDGADVHLYVDNTLLSSFALPSHYNTGTAAIGVGNYPYGAGSTFNGGADELFVYRKALSTEELTLLYNSGTGRRYLEGPSYDIIDTLSSTLVLNRIRLSAEAGTDSTIAFFDAIGTLKKGMTFSDLRASISGGAITPTLQQVINAGNNITSGANSNTITAAAVALTDATNSAYFSPTIAYVSNGSEAVSITPSYASFGTNGFLQLLKAQAGLSANKDIYLPNGNANDTLVSRADLKAHSYTPTLTNTTNISASSLFQATYMRMDSIVEVSITGQLTPTLGAMTNSELRFSLPITTSSATNQAWVVTGNFIGAGVLGNQVTGIGGLVSTTVGQFFFQANSTSSSSVFQIKFQYKL